MRNNNSCIKKEKKKSLSSTILSLNELSEMNLNRSLAPSTERWWKDLYMNIMQDKYENLMLCSVWKIHCKKTNSAFLKKMCF